MVENTATMMLDQVEAIWPAVIRDLRLHDSVVYMILHSVRPVHVAGSTITLLVTTPFHKKRLEQPDSRRLLEQVLSHHLGMACHIVCAEHEPSVTTGSRVSPPALVSVETPPHTAIPPLAPAAMSDTLAPFSTCSAVETHTEAQDIAIIPNLHGATAQELRRRGLTTLVQVAQLSLGDWQTLPQVDKKHAIVLRASVQAIISGTPVTLHPRQEVLPGFEMLHNSAGLFLDLESKPGTQHPFAFGTMTPAGSAHIALIAPSTLAQHATSVVIENTSISFIANAPEGWKHITHTIKHTSGKVMHWGLYEQTCLKHSATCDVSKQLLPYLFDVHHALIHQVALPIGRVNGKGSTTLKAVGNYLGITWPPNTSWQEAWNVYQAWYQGDTSRYDLLTPLVRYLWTDLEALRRVWVWLREIV